MSSINFAQVCENVLMFLREQFMYESFECGWALLPGSWIFVIILAEKRINLIVAAFDMAKRITKLD